MVIYILAMLVLILAVYSAAISYLFFKSKEEENKRSRFAEGKVESKIYETRERLKEVRSRRYTKVDLDEVRDI